MTTTSRRAAGPVDATSSPQARWRTLPSGAVTIDGGIWAKRQAVNRASALPHGFRMLEQAGNFENLTLAAQDATQGYRGPVFMDSDVYKWIEAAALELSRQPSDELLALVDRSIDAIEPAQKSDGYLNSYYTVAEPGRRWIDFGHGHELYCAGHLFQAAVAHYRATGSDRLLNVARRFADHIDATFGPGKRQATPGHPEIETALVELYRETGERRYLDLAVFLLDNRGHGWLGPSHRYGASSYFQDRVLVRDSSEVEGHAVRALYLTAGVADVYLETGEQALFDALQRQFTDMVSRKLYLTGGVGSRHLAEAFGKPYELPNELAYCETCAAIASIMWCWRMLLITGEARFADLAERTLYNAVLSGVSLDGSLYFYVNPLADNGETENLHRGGPSRKPWHNVACCPPNVMRLVASLGHYAVSQDAGGLQIHQYGDAKITADLPTGGTVTLSVAGEYPWDGRVRVSVVQATGDIWALSLRVPGWCESASVRVNGEMVAATPGAGGYLAIERAWQAGDTVELDLPMTPRLTEGHPWIESTRGCVAIERGPLVYCLEQADQEAPVYDLEIDPTVPLTSTWQPDLLDGVTTVHGSGYSIDRAAWEGLLYRSYNAAASSSAKQPVALTAIPVYAWANRGPNAMKIWIPLG
jgi:uncharacterized protein